MASFDSTALDFRRLDLLAGGGTAIHRLDARSKVLATIAFIISIVSFEKHELTALFPFFIFPAFMIARGNLPPLFIAKKIALLLPLILAVGIFNPFLDRETTFQIGSLSISGGWISFASIVVRAILTIGAAFILVGVTGFNAICHALEQMGMPRPFAIQLLLLYRYIFVLAEEAGRTLRAWKLRSCGGKSMGIRSYGSLAGNLLIRTWQRAEQIHLAMLARGFNGEFHLCRKPGPDAAGFFFLLGWSALFIIFRLHNIPHFLGSLVAGLFT